MDSKAWQKLFLSIRGEDQDNLVITTAGGPEIAVANIARAEEDVVLIRGRIAGQAESGRLFIVPYQRIVSIYVNRAVLGEEVELFSPSVPAERKEKVAAHVAELAAKAREQANAVEASVRRDQSAPIGLKEQLERLREQAGFSEAPAAAAKPEPRQDSRVAPRFESRPEIKLESRSEPRPETRSERAPAAPSAPESLMLSASPQTPHSHSTIGPPTLPPRLSIPKPPPRSP